MGSANFQFRPFQLVMNQDGTITFTNFTIFTNSTGRPTWGTPPQENQLRGASMFVAIVTLSVFAASICVLVYYSIKRLDSNNRNVGDNNNGLSIFGRRTNNRQQPQDSPDKPPSYEDIVEAAKNDDSLPTYEDAQLQLQEISASNNAGPSGDDTQLTLSTLAQVRASSSGNRTNVTRITITLDNEDALSETSCPATNYTTLGEDRFASRVDMTEYINETFDDQQV